MIERVDHPTSGRGLRALDGARRRAVDELGGRTVWCATALASRRAAAALLRGRLQWGGRDVACNLLDLQPEQELRDLGEKLDQMLAGRSSTPLSDGEREICAARVSNGEDLARSVAPDDVVVVHDPVSAMLVQPLRERGVHTVWHTRVAAPLPATDAGRSFLHRFTTGLDAYLATWSEPSADGTMVERIVALMPSADLVAGREIPAAFASGEPRQIGWSSVLAEVVHGDRDETVGGTRHARPKVPAR
jgi:trehalose synthase